MLIHTLVRGEPSSTGFGFGFEFLGGAFAKALMMFPEVLRFIVVVDFSGSLSLSNLFSGKGGVYFGATDFVSGGGDFCFGKGFVAGAAAFPFEAAVWTTTAGGTYFVNCRFFYQKGEGGRVQLH